MTVTAVNTVVYNVQYIDMFHLFKLHGVLPLR
jgi:hypothetical protein